MNGIATESQAKTYDVLLFMLIGGQCIGQHKHTEAMLLLNIHHPRAEKACPSASTLYVVMPGLAVQFISSLLK